MECLERLLAILRSDYLVPAALELISGERPNVFLIVGKKNAERTNGCRFALSAG
jgi:hypothetical protein